MASGTVAQICHLMSSYGSKLAWTHAHDCLCAARVHCLAQRQHELVRQKGHESVVDCMRAHPTSELVQRAGCEVLGLLAGGPNGLQQVVFEAGALPAVLDACEVFFESEGVLGAAFHTISNMCAAAGGGDDPEGCMRKQCAVELHALEVISEGMVSVPRAKWLQEAGVVAVGCLCTGLDTNAHYRRRRAKEVGAIQCTLRAMKEFPPDLAAEAHATAYRAACVTVQQVHDGKLRAEGPRQ